MNLVEVTTVAMLTGVKGRGGEVASRFSGRLAQVSGGELVKALKGRVARAQRGAGSRRREERERARGSCSNGDLLLRGGVTLCRKESTTRECKIERLYYCAQIHVRERLVVFLNIFFEIRSASMQLILVNQNSWLQIDSFSFYFIFPCSWLYVMSRMTEYLGPHKKTPNSLALFCD